MRTKVLTPDCPKCESFKVREDTKFSCLWGKGKKLLVPMKGKIPKFCKLINKDK
jgi:hypothetical protein